MRFTVKNQVWEVIDTTAHGDLTVLVVVGRTTNRRGFSRILNGLQGAGSSN